LNKLIHQTRLTMHGKFSSLPHKCKSIAHSMKVQVILYKFYFISFFKIFCVFFLPLWLPIFFKEKAKKVIKRRSYRKAEKSHKNITS
jgi:hypothetical protein